jgi:hypothetical protein
MLTTHLLHLAQDFLAAPTVPAPTSTGGAAPTTGGINRDGIIGFFATQIAPILLAVLGVIFVGRASRGDVSRVLTSSAIVLIGLFFIAGAGTLFFFGDSLVKIILS